MSARDLRCLVVTSLGLDGLAERRHGAYVRLRMHCEALATAGFELDVVYLSPRVGGSVLAVDTAVTRELRCEWGLKASAYVAGQRPEPRALRPWLLHELVHAFRYRGSGMTAQFDDSPGAALWSFLASGRWSLAFAHKLPSADVLGRAALGCPIVFDLDDLEHVAVRRIAANEGSRARAVARLWSRALLRAQREAAERAAETLVCSDGDAALLRRSLRPGAQVVAVPNAVPATAALPPASGSELLMVGMYGYRPNADGAEWFVREVWPHVRTAIPAATVAFCGAASEALAAEVRTAPGVVVHGFVPALEPYYARARAVICPVRAGGGTRIKLLEAAMFGRPCVSTTIGAEGLGFVAGTHVLIGDSAEAFARGCIELLGAGGTGERLATAARALVVARYSREAIVARQASRWRTLAERRDVGSAPTPDGKSARDPALRGGDAA